MSTHDEDGRLDRDQMLDVLAYAQRVVTLTAFLLYEQGESVRDRRGDAAGCAFAALSVLGVQHLGDGDARSLRKQLDEHFPA